MLKEFKEFAVKGNVVDMGVGIVIGAAFTAIVKSFVADIVNPIIGLFTGGVDFSNLFLNLSGKEVASLAQAREEGLAVIAWGSFLNAVIAFLIVAWVLFLVIKGVNAMKREEEEEPPAEEPAGPSEADLLAEIRDLLREGRA